MQLRPSSRGLVSVCLAAIFVLLATQMAYAMRFVRFEISIDKKVVLETSQGDRGEKPDIVWNYLRELKLRPLNGYVIRPDADDEEHSTLKGNIRIYCGYGGGEATVSELKLVRDTKNRTVWRIDPKEVERTFKIRKRK